MKRAKSWDINVENEYRVQAMGWRDGAAYTAEIDYHPNGLISKLQSAQSGFFTYFSAERECKRAYLNRVKLYTYEQ